MKHLALSLAIALVGAAPLIAQTSSARNIPPGWVDGSKNPSQIPDKAAYRLVFIHLMLPASPDAAAIAHQEAKLKPIGLSDADKSVLKQALSTFASNYAAWKETGGAAGQAWNIVQTTQTALTSQLTADGNSKFSAYVALSKLHMVVNPND